MKSILITGGSGLIGKFLKNNITVSKRIITLDRTVHHSTKPQLITSIQGDITHININQIREIFVKYDVGHVVHCAGVKNVSTDDHHRFNESAVENFFKADFEKSRHFIIMGSVAEYGIALGEEMKEDSACNPISRYGVSKLKQTELCKRYFDNGYKINVLRLSNPILPDLPKTSFIGAILNSIITGDVLTINNLQIERDFVDGRDLSRFISHLIDNNYIKHSVVNFCYGKNFSYKHCIDLTNKTISDLGYKALKSKVTNGEELFSKARLSTTTLNEVFGFDTRYTLHDSLSWVISGLFANK